MATILFVSYEVHPTTWGGCGVLIHHAAEALLHRGHTVLFLLDIPDEYFTKFDTVDRLNLPHAEQTRAYSVPRLCAESDGAPAPRQAVPNLFQWQALRFNHAFRKVAAREAIDFTEFFEYCGAGYYAFADRLFGRDDSHRGGILGARLHTSIELLDACTGTRFLDAERNTMYGLERRALDLAEVVLAPTAHFYEECYAARYRLEPSAVVVSEPPRLPFPRVASRPSSRGSFTIVTVGRMYQFKGVDTLVHAGVALMQRRPELDFRIVMYGADSLESPGGGSYAAYLRTMIPAPLRDRFQFPGQVPHERLAEELNHALFAVFPNRFESFCYALHEVYDAGVPVITSNLPAFADYFHHGRNALVFDGSTAGLLAAMEQMIDDDAGREHMARPYPVATAPLGNFYENPTAPRPLAPAGAHDANPVESLIVVLAAEGCDGGAAVRSLRTQEVPPAAIVVLHAAHPDAEETFWWLGRPWHVRGPQGEVVNPSSVLTRSAAAVLAGTDEPGPRWLALCQRALSRRASLGFAGTWSTVNGTLASSTLDLAPEAWPFEHPGALTRALIRTAPGQMLVDLFDPNLGHLGESGLLWQAINAHGHGCVLGEAHMATTDARAAAAAADSGQLKLLVARYAGTLRERLAMYATIVNDARAIEAAGRAAAAVPVIDHTPHPPQVIERPPSSLEGRIAVADELGGRTLVRLVLKKFGRKMKG